MSLTNGSYITDLTELGYYTNMTVFKQLCTIQEDAVDPATTLSGTRLDRAYAAMNYGKDQIDSMLNGTYSVPFNTQAVSNSFPSSIVKRWNVDFAVVFLYQLHHDKIKEITELLKALEDRIRPYIDNSNNGLILPGHTKLDGALGYLGSIAVPGAKFDTEEYFSSDVLNDD